MEILRDLMGFVRERKKFWLWPIVLVLSVVGLLVALTGGFAVSPFIYALY
jgi:hypothetical protein